MTITSKKDENNAKGKALHSDNVGSEWHDATICSVSKLTPTVTGLTLQLKEETQTRFSFLPGQWVDFYIPSIQKIGGYSMTSIPSQLPTLELAVKTSQHAPAHWVTHDAKVGDSVRIRVGGDFFYDIKEGNCRLLFIAGGVGINPIYSMMRQLYEIAKTSNTRAAVLYSASTHDELLFENELLAMEATHPGHFRIRCTITQEDAGSERVSKATRRQGRISSDLIGNALSWLRGNDATTLSAVYICGPPGMAEEMSDICCNKFGVSKDAIHFEKWW